MFYSDFLMLLLKNNLMEFFKENSIVNFRLILLIFWGSILSPNFLHHIELGEISIYLLKIKTPPPQVND
jgi:hypothetical protein